MSKIAEYHRAHLEADASWREAEYFLSTPSEPPVGEPPGVGEPIYEPMSEIELEKLLAEGEAERVDLYVPISDKLAAEIESQSKAELRAILDGHRSAPAKKPRKVRSRPQREAARRVLDSLYKGNIPDPVTLPNKLLCRHAQEHARSFSFPFTISDDTFKRAAGRK